MEKQRVAILGGGSRLSSKLALALLALHYEIEQTATVEQVVHFKSDPDMWTASLGFHKSPPHSMKREDYKKLTMPRHSRSHRRGKK